MSVFRLEVTPSVVPSSDVDLVSLTRALGAFHVATPLLWFRFTRQGSTLSYDYKFRAVDDRRWNQVIAFDNPANPLMTFDVPNGWRLSEFSLQRPVRDIVISLRQRFAIDTIEGTFTA